MVETQLIDRDYTVIIAKTADEQGIKPPGFADRWTAAQTAALALAQTCEALDPDGITVYVACRSPEETCFFRKHDQVTSQTLSQIMQDSFPPPKVNLDYVLRSALEDYFARKATGKTKANGEIILVLIDGEPDDRMAVAKTIKEATHQMERDEELGIGLLQIGNDLIAKGYLTALDHHLQGMGAKFDIVVTRQLETIEPHSLTDFLISTLHS